MGYKGSDFYLRNPVFYTKVGIFLLVGLLSIHPTIQYFKWVAATKLDEHYAPTAADLDRVRLLVKVQLMLLATLPLLAALMARAIGTWP